MRTRVEARDLRPGDYLPFTQRTVEAVDQYPSGQPGKVRVKLEGEQRSRLWGRYTEIVVEAAA
jgi:hypothetical protein